MIPATFGRPGSSSYASAALQSSLESRLRRRLEGRGSIVFTLAWKRSHTPSGRSICLLRASARTTTERGYGSWPTPLVNDTHGSGYSYNAGNHESISLKLCGAVKLASWNTPTADEAGGTPEQMISRKQRHQSNGIRLGASVTALNLQAQLASWATPNVPNGGRIRKSQPVGSKRQMSLETQVLSSWPTPTAALADKGVRTEEGAIREAMRSHGPDLAAVAAMTSGKTLTGFRAAMASPGQLSPEHSRWLQGYPASWAQCSPGWMDRQRLIDALRLATEPCS